jgi:hypothetical protein
MSLPEIHLATDGDLNYALFKHNDVVSNGVRSGGYEKELQSISSELLEILLMVLLSILVLTWEVILFL